MSQTGLDVFDETLQQTHGWLNDVGERLGRDDRQLAYHALRSTLQTLRDRIGIEHAPKLAAQLPLLMRGIFYEGWDPGADPAELRAGDAFLERVHERYGYRGPVSTEDLVRAVLETMNAQLTAGITTNLRDAVGGDLRELWPEPARA